MSEYSFTYSWYKKLIDNLRSHNYSFCDYYNWNEHDRCVIMRHDIDYSIERALRIAEIENENDVRSTFFVILTSDFYNVSSFENNKAIKRIESLGHDIGLHFDETRYPETESADDVVQKIVYEAEILSQLIDRKIGVVSMHRPSERILKADIAIPNMINSYGRTFFKEFKYLSDSRRRWREPVDKVISDGTYERLHVLTHAFWYNDIEANLHDSVYDFVNSGNLDRYECMNENITDLDKIMKKDEVL